MASEWELRKQAENHGYPTTHAQFADYRKTGLIPEPSEGQWADDVLERLLKLRALGAETKALHRRAIRLHFEAFPVAPEKLRQAMVRLAGESAKGFPAAKRKMRQVACAVDSWHAEQLAAIRMRNFPYEQPTLWRRRDSREWAAILADQSIDDQRFSEIASEQYRHYAELSSLADIAFEERMVLLTVLALSLLLPLSNEL